MTKILFTDGHLQSFERMMQQIPRYSCEQVDDDNTLYEEKSDITREKSYADADYIGQSSAISEKTV